MTSSSSSSSSSSLRVELFVSKRVRHSSRRRSSHHRVTSMMRSSTRSPPSQNASNRRRREREHYCASARRHQPRRIENHPQPRCAREKKRVRFPALSKMGDCIYPKENERTARRVGRSDVPRVFPPRGRTRGDALFRRSEREDAGLVLVRVRVVRHHASSVFAKIFVGLALSHARERHPGEEERTL